jgi:hypothetical protein
MDGWMDGWADVCVFSFPLFQSQVPILAGVHLLNSHRIVLIWTRD